MLALDDAAIEELRGLLRDLHYDAVLRSLHPQYFYWLFPPPEAFDAAARRLPERERVSYDCLLFGRIVPQKTLEQHWGRKRVESLIALGVLEAVKGGKIRTANYSIVAYLGHYFLVTLNPYYPGSRDPDASIYVGPDSLTLAAALVNLPHGARGLDLCTGSGIQAVFMSASVEQVHAVELNPQAAEAAAFNARLNGVGERLTVHQGNLYDALPDGQYDLIVSNPPFLPVPQDVHFPMCGHGGDDGLIVLRPLLEVVPDRLTENGTAIIYAEGVGDERRPFVYDLLDDLSRRANLDIHLMAVARMTVKNTLILKAMSLSKLKPTAMQELARWRDLYDGLRATHTYKYLLYLRHGQPKLRQVFAFDPQLEERGIEIQPGVIAKPRGS